MKLFFYHFLQKNLSTSCYIYIHDKKCTRAKKYRVSHVYNLNVINGRSVRKCISFLYIIFEITLPHFMVKFKIFNPNTIIFWNLFLKLGYHL